MSRLLRVSKCLLIAAALLMAPVSVSAEDVPSAFELVAENRYFALYIDSETTEVLVQQKQTGLVWSTNPLDRKTAEKVARGAAKNELEAQLIMHYYTPEDLPKTIDNYSESIVYGQFEIQRIENGVRVEYELGKKWDDYAYIPVFISKTRLDELLDRIDDAADRTLIRSQYYLISVEPYDGPGVWVDVHGFDFVKLLGNSQIVSDDLPLSTAADKRKIANLVVNHVHENRADYERADQVLPEDLEAVRRQPTYVRKSPLRPWDVPKLVEVFKRIDYLPEERANDDIEYSLDPPKPNQIVFAAAIEYVLDGDCLVVRVPARDLRYPKDVLDDQGLKVSYRLHSIDILPYFGAAGQNESGHIFVPDGSGALIYLNNGKTDRQPYQQPVYGLDNALSIKMERRGYDELVRLPVFGLATERRGHLALIEEGDTLARIRADVAGRVNSYNSVSARINVLPTARAIVYANEYGTADYLNVYQARSYHGDVTIRYFLLSGADANYAGMARRYQAYLVDRYGLSRLEYTRGLPLYLEVIGAVHRERPVFGIPRKVIEPLSTFEETRLMAEQLVGAGVSDLRLRLSGWLAGGLEHDYPAGVRLEKKLGTADDLSALNAHLERLGVSLFADVGFLNVPERARGFNVRRNASRFLTREIAKVYRIDVATNYYEPQGDLYSYVLSPAVLPGLVDRFMQDLGRMGIKGVSLRYMGEQLNSDFRPNSDDLVDRQQAKAIVIDTVAKVSGECCLMATGGFAYLLPCTRHILKTPMESSGFSILDEDVPFYQMVLRGYADYTGEPMNLAQDYEASILRTMETGASLYYCGFYADSSVVKHTDFDHYHASGFRGFAEQAVLLYREINSLMGCTAGERITDHSILASGVHMTTFESGVRIVVNYTETPFDLGDERVEGRSYRILEEHDRNEERQ